MKLASSLCHLPSSSIIPNPVKKLSSYMIPRVLQILTTILRGQSANIAPFPTPELRP